MLTRWLTLTAFLAASADLVSAAVGHGPLTVAPTCRVIGHPEKALTLNCGDGKNAGVVQYWHTPFGDLETPGFLSNLGPVLMHHDGSLVVPNTSLLHSGLYYCLLQHKEGTTLWPYELHVGHDNEKQHSCGAFRFRRDVGLNEETQGGVSDGQFAGAVAASVLLTFVLGFSAGALTRTQVLRCLGAVTSRLTSLRQQHRQTETLDHGSEFFITALPPMHNNQAFEMEQVLDDDSANFVTTESTISSTTSSPPVKPRRSYRQKREEEQEATAYLEGCDYMKVEEEERKSLKENNDVCDGEAEVEREFSDFYPSGKDGESQTKTEEDESSEAQEEKDGIESREERRQWKQGEEVEETGVLDISSTGDGEDSRGSEEEVGDEEKGREDKSEVEEGWREEKEGDDRENKRGEEDADTGISSKDEEPDRETPEDTMKNGTKEEEEPSGSLLSRGRRSRVIRLYQYDEDGQRYGHLPDPAPEEQGPAPRLKQRSLSLTRLSAIMATASAGPLDTRETEGEEREDRPHFHMEI